MQPHRRSAWQRALASLTLVSFSWSMVLATPAQTLTHQRHKLTYGMRNLTLHEMQQYRGSKGMTALPAAPGDAFPWQIQTDHINLGNGNKQNQFSLLNWTARGGMNVPLTLTHNSQSSTNRTLGYKWTHAFDLFATNDGMGNIKVHWGDDLSYTFILNLDGGYSPPNGIHDILVHNADNTYTLTRPDQIQYHFTTTLLCDRIQDANANTLTLAYNQSSQLTSVTDPSNRVLSFAYTSGRITSITDPLGRQWSLSYDVNGNLQTLTYPILSGILYTNVFTYNTTHDITDIQDARGNHWTFGYLAGDILQWQKDPLNNQTNFSYTSVSTTITDANGHQNVYSYSGGRLSSWSDPLGNLESYSYDASNNRIQTIDRRGYVWNRSYDGMGNCLSVSDPYNNTTSYTYNAHNKVLSMTDALNHTSSYTYDVHDNLLSMTDALNHTSSFTYNANGLCLTQTDPLNHSTTYAYNGNGDRTSITDPLGHQTTSSYNGLGWKLSATDPLNHTTSSSYDNWGRPITLTTPAGTTSITYDAKSNVLSITDANNHTSSKTYDADNRPISWTNGRGDVITYTYDALGKKGLLSSETDGNNHTTSITYTARNEKSGASYPDGTTESWTYNANGNLASRTNGKGNVITNNYDNANKLIGIVYPAGPNVSFTYDVANHRTGMTDATGTTGYTYNAANHLTQVVTPNGTVSYTFDNANRRTQMTLTGTGSWNYTYDSTNNLVQEVNPYNETTTLVYDAANRTTQKTNGNTSLTSYAYDSANRNTDVWHKKSDNATVLGHYVYQYDPVGNVTQRSDNDGSATSFGYDGANQLTSEQRSGTGAYAITYTYDHNGNRLSKTLNGGVENYSYDAFNKLLSAGSKTYAYDNDGNCTSVTVGGQTTQLSYDYEDRVTGITYPNSATNSFTYNGLGLRVRKTDSSGVFNYACDGTDVASSVLSDGAATYTPGQSERRSGSSKFYHSDMLGSTRGITDSSQNTTDSILYDGFGMTVSRTGATPTPFGFVGSAQYQSDKDSGLMLLGRRYYDCSIGRFLSRDPIKSGDNWYAYCGNNPLTRIDPRGEFFWVVVVVLVVGLTMLDDGPSDDNPGLDIVKPVISEPFPDWIPIGDIIDWIWDKLHERPVVDPGDGDPGSGGDPGDGGGDPGGGDPGGGGSGGTEIHIHTKDLSIDISA